MGVIRDADLAATFSSGRALTALEISEIIQKTGHYVQPVGRMGGHKTWHYYLRTHNNPLTEEGLMYLVEKRLRIVSSNPRYDTLIAKLFPDRRRSHELAEKFARIQNF